MTIPPDAPLRAHRDAYLEVNGFTMEGYTAPTFALPFLGREIHFPNPPTRQRAIARHDLHHALTGYGTDYVGEAEIGVWELRAGCNTLFLWAINLTAVALGVFLSPPRMWRAFRAAERARSLYLDQTPYEQLLETKLVDLRARCGIPPEGLAR
jgi:hypothetical protein